jgi:hypothetical protein
MKELTKLSSFAYKKRNFILLLVFVPLLVIHFTWIVKAAGDGKFFLFQEDEVIYYCSGKLFSATNSVRAEGCIEENVSAVGQMNWYGPGYNVVYGTLFKITGIQPAAVPWFHFLLAMGILIVVFFLPIEWEFRLVLVICLFATQQFCVYIYTFFPETLILFMATVLSFLFCKIDRTDNERRRRIYVFTFVICVLLFTLCRITFIFWLAGLIAFANSRKSMIITTGCFLAGVLASLVYMKLFTAPPYAGEMRKIDLMYAGQYGEFIKQSWSAFEDNIEGVFLERASVIDIFLGLLFVSVIGYFITRSRIILAALLISGCLFFVMFAYYTVNLFYFIKQTAMLIPLLLIALVTGFPNRKLAYALALVLLITFPSPFSKTKEAIQIGRYGYEHYRRSVEFENALSEISTHLSNKPNVILWDYREYDYGYATEALLPFASADKQPIMYTTNIVEASASAQDRFRLHNRLKVDYILSRHTLDWPQVKEVHATQFYHLYQLLNNY